MKKIFVVLSVLCALGVSLAASATAMQDDNSNSWFRQRVARMLVRRMEHQFDITDAQRYQIRIILKTEQPTIEALTKRVREERDQLNCSNTFDESAVRAFAEKHLSTTEDVLVERERVRTEIMRVLTPDQRKEAEQIRQTISAQLAARLASIGDQL